MTMRKRAISALNRLAERGRQDESAAGLGSAAAGLGDVGVEAAEFQEGTVKLGPSRDQNVLSCVHAGGGKRESWEDGLLV